MLFQLQDYLEAIGVHYGYLEGKTPVPEAAGADQMDLERLIQQMPVGDSVLQ
jgi:hypothetical protein